MIKPYDNEVIFLGLTLRHGEKSAIDFLDKSKFIFDMGGEFGGDHGEVWQAIVDTAIKGSAPTFINVLARLGDGYTHLLQSLVDRVGQYYHIYDFDLEFYSQLMQSVDKCGVLYNMSLVGKQLNANIVSPDELFKVYNKVDNIDQWATSQLDRLRQTVSSTSSGYKHISEIMPEVREYWDASLSGENLTLLDCGLPTLSLAKLFPRGKLAVLHGLSGSGKSSLAFQILLGTAFYLKRYNLPGCVAVNSLEMEQMDLVEKLVSILAQVDISKFIGGNFKSKELSELDYWSQIVERLPIYVDATNLMTTDAMTYRASGLNVSAHGPIVQLVTDYGELFADEAGSEEMRVNDIFRKQFHLARLLKASIIAISQSTHDKGTTGKTYIAGPDGTRYSRGVLQATDILIELWNPEQIEKSGREIIAPKDKDGNDISKANPHLFIQKYRKGPVGSFVALGWIPETTTFIDPIFNQPPGKVIYSHILDDFPAILKNIGMQEEAW